MKIILSRDQLRGLTCTLIFTATDEKAWDSCANLIQEAVRERKEISIIVAEKHSLIAQSIGLMLIFPRDCFAVLFACLDEIKKVMEIQDANLTIIKHVLNALEEVLGAEKSTSYTEH